jgi:RimJ/RimL family protein N-acetyltransferase
MADNLYLLNLYLRSGFQVEGLRRRALVRGGTVIDEYHMGKPSPREGEESAC